MNKGMMGGGNPLVSLGAMARSPAGILFPSRARGKWNIVCRDRDGALIHEENYENLVTTVGKNHALSTELDGGSQITVWYLGLISATPTPAAGDTMASHSGWTEVVAYSESVRQTWTGGTAASSSIDNSAAAAVFTINADGTSIGGAFLNSVSTKSGTTGTLYAVGAFTGGNITLNNGSTVTVTATFTM